MVFIRKLFRLVAICAMLALLLAAIPLVVSAEPHAPAQTAARPIAAPASAQAVASETDRPVAESKADVHPSAPVLAVPAVSTERPAGSSAGAVQAPVPPDNAQPIVAQPIVAQPVVVQPVAAQPVAAASLPRAVHASPVYDVESVPARKGKWIEVILSEQRLIAWEDGRMVLTTPVSTGAADTPTIRGTFRIYRKLPAQRMRGRDYDLPNVPHVMYFKAGYAMHGTYWHDNFGQPMSHGCVNIPTGKAAWLYDWAPQGTLVVVH